MRLALAWIAALLALGSFAAEPSAAPAATPAPAQSVYEFILSGAPYAIETCSRTEGPEETAVASTIALTLPGGGEGTLTQAARFGRDGAPRSYSLGVNVPGQQLVLSAVAAEGGYTVSITPEGATAPVQSKAVAATPPVFLLDNNVASHVDVLTRALSDLGPNARREITAIVPQVLQAMPATVQRVADGTGESAGTTFPTRVYRLSVASVGMELVARASDGALMQVEVPLQNLLIKRKDFTRRGSGPAESPFGEAAPDPREAATIVKSPLADLPARLLVPKAEAPVPAIVMLAGSGPNDRDETIGPNRPFLDIARGLGDRGIASLRFDKRTHAVADKSKLADVALKDEYYDDAITAIGMLKATPGVDPARIFVVGHSEGAMVAPKVASLSGSVRGLVLLAPGVRPIDVMIVDQAAYGAKLMGMSGEDIAEQTKAIQSTFATIKDPERKDTPPFMGAPAAYWRELIALDVPMAVAASKLPILVLQGDDDAQVRKVEDFELLKSKVGDTKGRVTFRSFPKLNHLFMPVDGASTGAEYAIPGHVDPVVIGAIADWVLAH